MDPTAALTALLTKIALPLLTIDRATLHVIEVTAARVHLHLGGAYAGCPGNALVERHLLAPLVSQLLPTASLVVTSGLPVPPGVTIGAAVEGDDASSEQPPC